MIFFFVSLNKTVFFYLKKTQGLIQEGGSSVNQTSERALFVLPGGVFSCCFSVVIHRATIRFVVCHNNGACSFDRKQVTKGGLAGGWMRCVGRFKV